MFIREYRFADLVPINQYRLCREGYRFFADENRNTDLFTDLLKDLAEVAPYHA